MLELPIKVKYYQKGKLDITIIDKFRCDKFDKRKVNSHSIIEKFHLELKDLKAKGKIIALPSFNSSQFVFRNEVVHGDIFYDEKQDTFYICLFKKGLDEKGEILKGFEKVVFLPIHRRLNDGNLFEQAVSFSIFNEKLLNAPNRFYFAGNLFIHSNVLTNIKKYCQTTITYTNTSILYIDAINYLSTSWVVKEHGNLWVIFFSMDTGEYFQEPIDSMSVYDVFEIENMTSQILLYRSYDYQNEKKYMEYESNALFKFHLEKLKSNGLKLIIDDNYTKFIYTVNSLTAETCLLFKNGISRDSYIFEVDLSNEKIFEPFYCLEENRTEDEIEEDRKGQYENLFLKFIANI